ncbi:hypothetical protein C8J57DRAFT_1475427 [Mycena rebaudengoi]|nr:hypothetical protein C8J57DRAFT_1475427 [Mycena rebaudengoi]
MKKFMFLTAFLATVAAGALHNISPYSPGDDCRLSASVRAEDLAPSRISHGELRIKVAEACASQIASVALRLQLSEFGEVKHLRHGAVIPQIQRAENIDTTDDIPHSVPTNSTNTRYDYGPYDAAMSDPDLWVVKAEERTSWSTEAVLFDNNPDFSEPRVTPFLISSPAVNYPPSVENHRDVVGSRAIRRHGFSQLGYIYTAIVNFTDGRTIEVPAGHTNFVPTSPALRPKIPFSWNVTFVEHEPGCEQLPSRQLDDRRRCLPEEFRSVFTAEVTLEEGNVVQPGTLVKGKVTFHSTNGSTDLSDIDVYAGMSNDYHWAAEQAENGGDPDYRKSVCQGTHTRGITPDAYPWIFQKELNSILGGHGRLHADQPFFNFEVQVPHNAAPDFRSYYSSVGAALELSLGVVYSEEAATCITDGKYSRPDFVAQRAKEEAAQAAHDENALWDTFTHVPEQQVRLMEAAPSELPIESMRRLELKASVPLVILGDISTQPVDHYLTPGLPSPVLTAPRSVLREYPELEPEVVQEPHETTAARLMQSGGTYAPQDNRRIAWPGLRIAWSGFQRDIPDPLKRYLAGGYAGLLWKKKLVAMERGLIPQSMEAPARNNVQEGFTIPAFEQQVLS